MITPFASYPPSDAPEFIKYSHHLIDLALRKARRPAILCSYGKDSGVVLHLLSQHVDLSRIDVIYIDSTFEFPAFYKHIAGMKAFSASGMAGLMTCTARITRPSVPACPMITPPCSS